MRTHLTQAHISALIEDHFNGADDVGTVSFIMYLVAEDGSFAGCMVDHKFEVALPDTRDWVNPEPYTPAEPVDLPVLVHAYEWSTDYRCPRCGVEFNVADDSVAVSMLNKGHICGYKDVRRADD